VQLDNKEFTIRNFQTHAFVVEKQSNSCFYNRLVAINLLNAKVYK